MKIIKSTIAEQRSLKRWIVLDNGSNPTTLDSDEKIIGLQTRKYGKRFDSNVFAESLKQLKAFVDKPPTLHGKFFLDGSKFTAEQFSGFDDRFVIVSG